LTTFGPACFATLFPFLIIYFFLVTWVVASNSELIFPSSSTSKTSGPSAGVQLQFWFLFHTPVRVDDPFGPHIYVPPVVLVEHEFLGFVSSFGPFPSFQ